MQHVTFQAWPDNVLQEFWGRDNGVYDVHGRKVIPCANWPWKTIAPSAGTGFVSPHPNVPFST